MRRKTKIVLGVTVMATALVAVFSYIYISQLLRQRITTAHETAARLTSQLAYLATNAAPDLSSTKVDTSNPVAVRKSLSYYLSTDRDLNMLLESVVGNWPMIYDAAIVDANGSAARFRRRQLPFTALHGRGRAGLGKNLECAHDPALVLPVDRGRA